MSSRAAAAEDAGFWPVIRRPTDNGEALPVGSLLIAPPEPLQLVLDKERHDVGELNGFLLGVGETRDALALLHYLPKHRWLISKLSSNRHRGILNICIGPARAHAAKATGQP